MKKFTPLIAIAIALTSIGSVLVAAYVEPFAHNVARPIFAFLGLICAVIGTAVAGRQVWLQHLPAEEVPACGPPLEYMLEVFPLLEVVQHALMGTGDCAEIQWQWLGLSIPGWSIILFLGLALGNLLVLFRRG